MAKLASLLRTPFSFLFSDSSVEERVVAYLLREHHRGRQLEEIIQDRYIQNRLSPQQLARVIERPAVIHAVGEDDVAAARTSLLDEA